MIERQGMSSVGNNANSSSNPRVPAPVFVELKPDRNLLDPNFNGYKLSLEKLPTSVVSVKSGVDRAQATEQQYSLQHVKHFAVHNHIFSDPFNPFVVYIVDKLWTILRVSLDSVTERLDTISEVWRIPAAVEKKKEKNGRFNVTMSFPDDGHVVISDGCDTMYIVKTGDRKFSEPWNSIATFTPFGDRTAPQFSVVDCIKYKIGNDAFIDVLTVRIDDKNVWTEVVEHLKDGTLEGHSFLKVLEWFTFQGEGAEETKWILKSQRTLIGHSGTDYVHLEQGGTGLYLASDSRFHVVVDTEKPINFQETSSVTEVEGTDRKPEYLWTQTMEEVKLWFRVQTSIRKQDVEVEFKRESISILYKGRSVLEGPIHKPLNVEESYWIIETPKCLPENAPEIEGAETDEIDQATTNESKQFKILEVVLGKVEQGVVWVDEVVKGNSKGEYVSDPEFVETIHARLAHLCSDKWGPDPGQSDAYDPRQLEECDAYPADSSCLMRIDKAGQRISHLASLGSHQWLFNVRLEPTGSPAICIRHDVDGIIWKPHKVTTSTPTSSEDAEINWKCEHVGTFSALGYVQASKQQRKYTICSSDMSYVAICDVKKHIYVYRQPTKIESCLRNRRTGEHVTHVAKQLVISLDPPQDILGAYATPSYLYVLTPENFHAIRILAEEE